ncbi:hypothetical protein JKF63_01227 [Porcisia hertigi]|uniref:Uncharacterized protein n=1 Tax=Porcisia hertigi TaxID=2761500 RepID=A0A836I3B1_9TRYP|nr:hypothetical protein JKF63_01227 [Porcisia hertigi]
MRGVARHFCTLVRHRRRGTGQRPVQKGLGTPPWTLSFTVRLCSSTPMRPLHPAGVSPTLFPSEGECRVGDTNGPSPVDVGSSQHCASTSFMSSMQAAEGFTEPIVETPGYSDEDAFGHTDPLKAVEHAIKTTRAASATNSAVGLGAPTSEIAATPAVDLTADTISPSAPEADLAKEMDAVVSSRNRRRNRRKRTADAILGDVLHDALLLRDMGKRPTADFVYKRTQERMYEEEYGHKPPSAKENAAKFIPFPPDFHLHRLLPLFGDRGDVAVDAELRTWASPGTARPASPLPVYTKNFMSTYTLIAPDPWPERAVTPDNPVWTRRDVELDKEKTGGQGLKEWEERMYGPRRGCDACGEFVDAMDELGHWEVQLIHFLRVVPLSQRRSLPFLHEWYRLLVHRVIRAERRYIRIRDAVLASTKATTSFFNRTEQVVEAVRSYYAEAHRSLASANYDPLRMKKSALAPLMRMSDDEFSEWKEVQRQRRNSLAAELA